MQRKSPLLRGGGADRLWLAALALLAAGAAGASQPPVEHRLTVRLLPTEDRIEAEDRLRLPADLRGTVLFELHRNLEPEVEPPARLEPAGDGTLPWVRRWRLDAAARPEVLLRWSGRLPHGLRRRPAGPGREETETVGFITPNGAYLDGATRWYPVFPGRLLRYELALTVPLSWHAVAGGDRVARRPGEETARELWRSPRPMEEVVLVAGHFHRYVREGTVPVEVYLRRPDPETAGAFLDRAALYLGLYGELLGPYPYARFAVVENLWESGYGLPGFTLLGPSVIRLPFVTGPPLAHEVLHNWWGNGVYVDPAGGNWSEALTVYLADHLLEEREGRGAAYRLRALERYAHRVRAGEGAALEAFRGRHDTRSQAVGYDQGMMFFHMLRLEVGDHAFLLALRRLYREGLARRVGYEAIRRAMEEASGRDLGAFFRQWLERPEPPRLRLEAVAADGEGLELSLSQSGHPPFRLWVPVAVGVADRARPWETTVRLQGRSGHFPLKSPGRPLWVWVDPRFDLFRRLDRRERPPSLDELFHAPRPLLVLPTQAPRRLREAYHLLARRWVVGLREADIVWDDELRRLPVDRAVWILGWANRFRPEVEQLLAGREARLDAGGARLEGRRLGGQRYAVALALRRGETGTPLGWLGCADPRTMPELARRLPHYGGYGYVAFDLLERGPRGVRRTLAGRWPLEGSPLARALDPDARPEPVPPRPALTEALPEVLRMEEAAAQAGRARRVPAARPARARAPRAAPARQSSS